MRELIFLILIFGLAAFLAFYFVYSPVSQQLNLCYEQSNQALEKESQTKIDERWIKEKILLRNQGKDPEFEKCKKRISQMTGLPQSLVNLINWPLIQKDKEETLKY